MKLYYDPEEDVLEVQFKLGQPQNRTGIGLTDQITIFCDTSFQQALGFTALSYSRLLALPESHLNELNQAPQDIQEKIRKLIINSPLNRFFNLIDGKIGLRDIKISESIALY